MAKVDFIGVQDIDFYNDRGEHIDGISLFVTYKDPNVYGIKADKKFVSRDQCKNIGFTVDYLLPFVGKEVELETNLKGKVIGISDVS
ncbi:MAG: hypothetical protein IJD85_05280 [Oscillospiraceae bacterium]|nr:hypothetical protein [Oscillospiraceae bacterium]